MSTNYSLDSFKIEYAEFGTGPDRVEVRSNNRVSAADSRDVVDRIRDTLLSSGWKFLNPYPTVPLGSSTLINKTAISGGIQLVVGPASPPFNTGAKQYLLVSRVSGPLFPPTLYQTTSYTSGGGSTTFEVKVESGVDRDWLVGSKVEQVRGIVAEGVVFLPGYGDTELADYAMAARPGFDFDNCSLRGCIREIGACGGGCGGFYGKGGICTLLTILNTANPNWRFASRNIEISPLLGSFTGMAISAKIGRNFLTGLPDGDNDTSGTQSNLPSLAVTSSASPFYSGGPTSDVIGGGWMMESYPTPTGIKFGVAITQDRAVIGISSARLRFLEHGSSINFYDQTALHSCPLPSRSDDQFFFPRIENAPDYHLFCGVSRFGLLTPTYAIIANPYQFWIIDQINSNDSQGAFGSGGNSLFAGIPFIDPAKTPGLYDFAIVVGPGTILNNLAWGSIQVSIAINSNYNTFVPGGASPDGLGISTIGTGSLIFPYAYPLRASNNKPILTNAYLWCTPDAITESSIMGKLYDALVVTDNLPIGSQFAVDNHQFEIVSSQHTGPNACLAICTSPTSFDNF